MISVIIPTYNEAENIRVIVPDLSNLFKKEGVDGEIIVVDDNSPDGTAEVASELADQHPVRVHVRRSDRGLSKAVIEGFALAKGDICVVMDADLSHPVEKLPLMIRPILEGRCDATVGSRYVQEGGSQDWGQVRKAVSKGAGLLAKGVTTLSDPTSGFMAIRKSFLDGKKLDPLGWKIVLEVMVKTDPRVLEIPIVFPDRKRGKSKLGLKAQIDYLHHLWRLYVYRYQGVTQFIRFSLVGTSGIFVDTAVIVGLVDFLFFDPRFAMFFAFAAAVTWNYLLNRLWTFESARSTKVSYSYVSFVSVSLTGLGVRFGVMHVLIAYAGMRASPWYILANLAGIASAAAFNFLGSKYIAFGRFMRDAKGGKP